MLEWIKSILQKYNYEFRLIFLFTIFFIILFALFATFWNEVALAFFFAILVGFPAAKIVHNFWIKETAIKKYIEVYKKTDNINSEDYRFRLSNYSEYYYHRDKDKKISEALDEGKNVLIMGRPKAGKTRAAYEAIRKIKGFKVIKFWEKLIQFEEIPDNIFKGRIIVFIDDLNKYEKNLNFYELIKKLNEKSDEFLILATCRTGEEYNTAMGEFGDNLREFEEVKIEDVEEEEGKEIAKRAKIKFNENEFDKTIGSLFLGLHTMKERYRKCPEQGKVFFITLKFLHDAGIFTPDIKTVKKLYEEKLGEEGISRKLIFKSVVGLLKENSLIYKINEKIGLLHDSYLGFTDYEASADDLRRLEKILFELRDENGLYQLGQNFFTKYLDNDAIDCFNMALEINPRFYKAWNKKGFFLQVFGKYQEAMECYDKAVEINPEFAEAYYNKGTALEALEKIETAIQFYDKALEKKGEFAEAWNNKGFAFYRQGKLEKAMECYENALKIDSRLAAAWNNKGLALIDRGEYQTAKECLDKALDINPKLEDALYNKGVALYNLGQFEEAIKFYDKRLGINENYDRAWNNKGLALEGLEKYDEAIKCYDKALEINPKNITALNNKSVTFYSLERYKESIESFDKALAINPENTAIREEKAAVLSRLGRYREAIESLTSLMWSDFDRDFLVGRYDVPETLEHLNRLNPPFTWMESETAESVDLSSLEYQEMVQIFEGIRHGKAYQPFDSPTINLEIKRIFPSMDFKHTFANHVSAIYDMVLNAKINDSVLQHYFYSYRKPYDEKNFGDLIVNLLVIFMITKWIQRWRDLSIKHDQVVDAIVSQEDVEQLGI